MQNDSVQGYCKKSNSQLLKEIDECTSLSQLFALIQLEGIVIQMHTQSGASNLKPKKLSPAEIIDKKDTPFERLRAEVKKAVAQRVNPVTPKPEIPVQGYQKKTKAQLLKEIDECTSLSQLFALIQLEGIVIQMHSQSGASNLKPRTLTPGEIIDKKDTPFERLRAEVRKAVEESNRYD